ncbi:MAG: DsbA family protein [Chloroflexota bacterium]
MSKRQEMRDKRAKQERNQKILVIAGVAVIAIAVALLLILPSLKPVGEIASHPLMNRPNVKFNGMGDPNAKVKIIEYSDFQCPYCAKFVSQTEQQLIDAYVATGKVYFEYHSFGDFIGPESGRAAEAAYCAGDQEKFWDMHDIIFANQKGENAGDFTDARLVAFAGKLGLDSSKFNDCFNNGKYKSQVSQDGVDAQAAGVKATPSFTVNGKLVEGAQPFSVFQTEIDALLK